MNRGLAFADFGRTHDHSATRSDRRRAVQHALRTSRSGRPARAGSTPVQVQVGQVRSGIGATLQPRDANGASISGTVFDAKTRTAQGDIAVVVDPGGLNRVTSTDDAGRYTVLDLPPSAAGYPVCFGLYATAYNDGGPDSDGPDNRTYVGQCTGGGSWMHTNAAQRSCENDALEYEQPAHQLFGPAPSDATRIPLSAGQHVTGIDAQLRYGATIKGHVFSPHGRLLWSVRVTARSLSDPRIFTATCSSDGSPAENHVLPFGHYALEQLPASAKGYQVCFDGTYGNATQTRTHPLSPYGYVRKCLRTPVAAQLGHVHAHVDTSLAAAGAITGKVTGSADGKPVQQAIVEVFSGHGHVLGKALTSSTGTFHVRGLPAASADRVCAFDRTAAVVDVHAGSYRPACYPDVVWSGTGPPPSSARAVRVRLGASSTVHIRLPAGASIDGTVRSSAGALVGARIYVVDAAGHDVDVPGYPESYGTTGADAHIHVVGLAPSRAGYRICALPYTDPDGKPRTYVAPTCFGTTYWDGSVHEVPAAATLVPVRARQHVTGVHIVLAPGGAISGVVNGTAGPVTDRFATLFTHAGHQLGMTETGSDGAYSFSDLAPSSAGYYVCFSDYYATPVRYLDAAFHKPQCYDGVQAPVSSR